MTEPEALPHLDFILSEGHIELYYKTAYITKPETIRGEAFLLQRDCDIL